MLLWQNGCQIFEYGYSLIDDALFLLKLWSLLDLGALSFLKHDCLYIFVFFSYFSIILFSFILVGLTQQYLHEIRIMCYLVLLTLLILDNVESNLMDSRSDSNEQSRRSKKKGLFSKIISCFKRGKKDKASSSTNPSQHYVPLESNSILMPPLEDASSIDLNRPRRSLEKPIIFRVLGLWSI